MYVGQDPFRELMPQYARRSASAIVMCDVMRRETMLEGAKEWKRSVDNSVYLPNGQPIPCILLVNKVGVVNPFPAYYHRYYRDFRTRIGNDDS